MHAAAGQEAIELFDKSPALFVANEGQWADESVRYAFFGSGANVLHTDSGPVFQLFQTEAGESHELDGDQDSFDALGDLASPQEVVTRQTQFSVQFDGADHVEPIGLDQAETVHNYFVGDESNWREGVPTYATVAYLDLYDGIDLYTWGRRDSVKYEFHVAPGEDYRQIQVSYDGIENLWLGDDGTLHVQTELGELVDAAPYIYQEIGGEQVEVTGRFELLDADTYSFNLTGPYDPGEEMVIDPELAWSTYLGGNDPETIGDSGRGIAADAAGNVLVTGSAWSAGWVSGGFDTTLDGRCDAFVAKISPTGEHVWSTYVGGYAKDGGRGIAVDVEGSVLVTGYTRSSGWVSGGFDTTYNGSDDTFVAKLSPSGAHIWSTYLGGDSVDVGLGVAVDAAGNSLVVGRTSSSGWASGGFDVTYNGETDAFAAKLSPTGDLVWSTFIGGVGQEFGYAIAVDAAGNALVTGNTRSPDWVSGGFETTYNDGGSDAFVAKISPAGGHVWSTYLGSNEGDVGAGIVVDAAGSALVTGLIGPADWVSGGFDTTYNGQGDGFIAKLSPSGAHVWSSYIGGGGRDWGYGIAMDAEGNALVVGNTRSSDWVSGGFDTTYNGGDYDAFVAEISPTGGHVWSTYLGGNAADDGCGIAVDAEGSVLVTGTTHSAGWVSGGFDTTLDGWKDAFVAKIVVRTTNLGDVNDDDQVNGLDVDPFVSVLLSGPFNAAADMNADGVVNGLDVDSFVAAVVGGSVAAIERNDLGLQSTAQPPQRSHESSAARLTARRSFVRSHLAGDTRRLGLNEIVGSLARRVTLRDWQATVDRAFGGATDWIGQNVR